jgi:hypothetical protein
VPKVCFEGVKVGEAAEILKPAASFADGLCLRWSMREKLQDTLAYPPRLMDVDRASAYVSFGRTKFLELVDRGLMPQPIYIDDNPRWDRFELDAAVNDLKDRRCDPVKRSRMSLAERLSKQEAEGRA